MAEYLLIESRDPFESRDVASYGALARDLAKAGNTVTVFLVENGVFAARQGAAHDGLAGLIGDGVEVLADEFSLRERGIASSRLVTGVHAAPLDTVIDHLAAGRKTLWH